MKNLRDFDVKEKRVLVRVDFNVDIDKDGRPEDDFKIRKTLPTIKYLLENDAKIILMSHLGEPVGGDKEESERKALSLKWVAQKAEELLGKEINFINDCVGEEVQQKIGKIKSGEIALLENLRFHKEEIENNEEFARQLASLGEIYVNDAFSVCHREHASLSAITKFLPSCGGLLLMEEVDNLTRVRDAYEKPLCVIIGGAKISTKIKLIESFFGKAQDIILGGALANTVLHAKGIAVGKSMIEEDMGEEVKKLEITDSRIHLPVDTVVCTSKEGTGYCHTAPVGKMAENELILDIGKDSEKLFANIIANAKMVVWNGPIGYFEIDVFTHGSRAVAEAIVASGAFSIVGGGETVSLVERMGLIDKFSFISTGGGAMLKFLAGDKLPGLEALG
jgi:phosphoglycerate kinase